MRSVHGSHATFCIVNLSTEPHPKTVNDSSVAHAACFTFPLGRCRHRSGFRLPIVSWPVIQRNRRRPQGRTGSHWFGLFFGLLAGLLLVAGVARAETVTVATAANFHGKVKELAAAFEKDTGHKVTVISGASGVLAGQILNGAPFDVFLSADQDRPNRLIRQGAAVAESRLTYACGKLFLWAPGTGIGNGQPWQYSFARLVIANPRLAPYGRAAREALKCLPGGGRPKLVLSPNVLHAFSYVGSGAAPAGFVAGVQVAGFSASQQRDLWRVPESCYRPIRQDAVLLSRAKANKTARAFMTFLKSKTNPGRRCGP